jgi:ATP-binding cassette subfamily F protein 3
MIRIDNLTYRIEGRPLFEQASATIPTGHKVGLVGRNGTGKTTLFRLITGETEVDGGDISLPRQWRIAGVKQEVDGGPTSLLDTVLEADVERSSLLAESATATDPMRIAEIEMRLVDIGAHRAPARAAEILAGLGFDAEAQLRACSEFSGGWRMRVALAAVLFSDPDLLLLDEPTNYLDLEGSIWLEQYLRRFQGTMILISHDRDLLNTAVNSILHLEDKKLTFYTGAYDTFERTRSERLAVAAAARTKQDAQRKHMQDFVDRFRAKASKARQAQSRIKALERMELIAPAHVDSPFAFHFREFPGSPDPALVLDDAVVGYDGKPVLEGVKLTIQAGARIGLLGRNGAGKTTLVKLLAGRLPALAGERHEGKNLRVGYFAQQTVEILRPDESPLAHLARIDPRAREQVLRDYLGGFDFSGDMAVAPVADFSGGEKARLALALILWQQPNLLLLDEPTNHLDLDMREALALALQEFEGAMVLVSHDRHLLRTATDSLMLVADGRLTAFDGDLEDYRAWLDARRSGDKPKSSAGTLRREQKRAEAEARQALARTRKPLEKRLAAVEADIARIEREKAQLEGRLASPSFYQEGDQEEVAAALREQTRLVQALDKAERQWLELQAQIEAIG